MDENRPQVYNPIIPKALRTKSFLIHVVLSVLDLRAAVVSAEHPYGKVESFWNLRRKSAVSQEGRLGVSVFNLVAELSLLCTEQRSKQKQGALST